MLVRSEKKLVSPHLSPAEVHTVTLTRNLSRSACAATWANDARNAAGRSVIPRRAKFPEVEHIDGDWQNNRLTNLTLLRPNCHALTPAFRGLNRGRGRPYRLGGRENPLASEIRPSHASGQATYKVFDVQSPQLEVVLPT